MLYRENTRNGDMLSQLGFGCMRFPHKLGQYDTREIINLIDVALDQGVNYFDTAYLYNQSEQLLGYAHIMLNSRSKMKIATKMPVYFAKKSKDFDRYFTGSLESLRTEYVDYYLMHMLGSLDDWDRLKNMGIENWIAGKKESGEIRNIGFSFHGSQEEFIKLIDAYDWEFCQVQFNYLDENSQAGYSGIKYAYEKGIPVFVMEPLRGGLLINGLPTAAATAFAETMPERSYADWGLRWVLNHKEVTLALSGMSTPQQILANAATANYVTAGCLTQQEYIAYERVVKAFENYLKIPCTSCGYCQPCPNGVNIPICFSSYNQTFVQGRINRAFHYYNLTGVLSGNRSDAAKCTKCGVCLERCPQGINIPEQLGNVRRRTFSSVALPALNIARWIIHPNKK